jgi:hypothetical protein
MKNYRYKKTILYPISIFLLLGLSFNVFANSDIHCSYILLKDKDFLIWYQDATKKVFRELKSLEDMVVRKKVTIKAAKGEYEPFQLVITPEYDMEDVELKFTDLIGPDTIGKENLYYNLVEYVEIRKPSSPDINSGFYPDPLLPRTEYGVNITENINNPFWITIKIPRNIAAGNYEGKVEIFQNRKKLTYVPIELRIWDFFIPKRPSIYTSASLHNPYFRSLNQPEIMQYEKGSKVKILKRYYKNLIEHRITNYTHGPLLPDIKINVLDLDEGKVEISTLGFDSMMKYVTGSGMEKVSFPGVPLHFPSHTWESNAKWEFGNIKIKVFKDSMNTAFTENFNKLFKETYSKICKHLEDRRWLDNTVVSILDEPRLAHKPTINAMYNLAALFKEINPAIKMRVTDHPVRTWSELYDLWVVHSNKINNNLSEIRSMQKLGDQVMVYNNVIPIIDFPGMRIRTFPWAIWKYGLDGSLSWCRIANWRKNPWEDTKGGIRGLHGITILLYPPRSKNETGPINSIRWELFREGLEDYEYLHLLQEKVLKVQAKIDTGELSSEKEAKLQVIIDDVDLTLNDVNKIVYGLPYVNSRDKDTGEFDNSDLDQPYTRDVKILRLVRENIATQIEKMTNVFN